MNLKASWYGSLLLCLRARSINLNFAWKALAFMPLVSRYLCRREDNTGLSRLLTPVLPWLDHGNQFLVEELALELFDSRCQSSGKTKEGGLFFRPLFKQQLFKYIVNNIAFGVNLLSFPRRRKSIKPLIQDGFPPSRE